MMVIDKNRGMKFFKNQRAGLRECPARCCLRYVLSNVIYPNKDIELTRWCG